MAEHAGSDDYVWHFKLGDPAPPPDEGDALTEMVRTQLVALLRCVTFTHDGKDVRVTGFRFLADQGGDEQLIVPSLETDEAQGAE